MGDSPQAAYNILIRIPREQGQERVIAFTYPCFIEAAEVAEEVQVRFGRVGFQRDPPPIRSVFSGHAGHVRFLPSPGGRCCGSTKRAQTAMRSKPSERKTGSAVRELCTTHSERPHSQQASSST